ncbi:hypothetical protein GBF38_000385 [Nibea albiflora]|nr:hypothetical protein GBF38_000385 [Nibea albiflora]
MEEDRRTAVDCGETGGGVLHSPGAERRRQHDEAERKLADARRPGRSVSAPAAPGLSTPAPNNPTNTPPAPPTEKHLLPSKRRFTSPDTLYTAKFVSYAGDEEEDEEAGSGGGGSSSQSGQVKLSATRKSYGDLPAPPRPITAGLSRRPLRASPALFLDGIFLSGSFQPPFNNNSNSTGPPLPAKPSSIPPEALKVDQERGERSQARHSALHSSRPSLSSAHLFIYFIV